MTDVFRPARIEDIASITELVIKSDGGMTTLPKSHQDVASYVKRSDAFLKGDVRANRLLFVLESESEVVGISGIIPHLGHDRPFYSFKRTRQTNHSQAPKMSVTFDTLQLATDFDGCTELATLFIPHQARGRGRGRLLSFGRLGFIHQHRDSFGPRLMADIRGWVNDEGQSPFWELLASKFIRMSFEEADVQTMTDGSFISQLLPSLPILLNLLPEIVSECAGKPHDDSAKAMAILKSIGFMETDLCDVFDGGPSIACPTDHNLISRNTKSWSADTESWNNPVLAYGGNGKDFRAIMVPAGSPRKEVLDCFGGEKDIFAAPMPR